MTVRWHKLAAIGLLGLVVAGLVASRLVWTPAPSSEIMPLIGPRVIGPNMGPQIGPRVGAVGSVGPPLILMLGDSIAGGTGNANNIGPVLENGVDTAFTPVTLAAQRAANTNDPPPFGAEFGPTALVAFSPGAVPGFGPEITLGRALNGISGTFGYLVKCGITSSFLSLHWLPSSSYGSTLSGGNLYRNQVARAHSYEALSARQVGVIYDNLGTNDASDTTAANAMAANMATMVNQEHADFPGAVIVWPLINVNTVQTFTATVRTQQTTYAATAPNFFKLLNIDEVSLADILHPDTPGILHIGKKVARAAADLRGIPRVVPAPAPALVGNGVSLFGGGATLAPLGDPETQLGDTELLIAQASGVTPGGGAGTMTITGPGGLWTSVTSGQSTAAGFTVTWAVFKRPVQSGESGTGTLATATVTFAQSTDNIAKRITVRGPVSGHQDVDVSASTVLNQFGAGPFTIASQTTTVDNDLVIDIVGGPPTSTGNVSTFTAAGLANVAKYTESYYTTTGSPSLGIWTGTLAAHGATGTKSLSFSLSTIAYDAEIVIHP